MAVVLVAALGTASADDSARQQRDRAADTSRTAASPNSTANAPSPGTSQHGGDTNHLPPVVKNMALVSKLSPQLRGAIEEGQIADVSVYKGFAYLNSGWDETSCNDGDGGTYVIDIRDPANPREVGFLPALVGNYHGEGAHVITVTTPQFSGDVLAVSNESCTGALPTKGGGFDLWNVTDPANATRFNPPDPTMSWGDYGGEGELVKGTGDDDKANETHSIFIWDAGDNAYAVFVDNEELHDVDIFDITNPASPQPVREYDLIEEEPGVWTETPNGDTPFHHDMVVKQIGGRFVLLASYWDAGYIQFDVTDPANAVYMSDTDFTTSDPLTGFDPPEGNAHQAEYTNDNRFIVTAEEDFAPDRLTQVTVQGVGTFPANAVGGGGSPNALDDRELNGPMAYGGYACPDPNPSAGAPLRPVPDAVATFPTIEPDEERILVVQRGPDGDTNEDYDGDGNISDADDACFPGNKADRARDAGWDAILIINRHLTGGAADDSPVCGSGGYTQFVVTACTTHEAGHEIFDDPANYDRPYDDETEMAAIGETSPHKLSATGTFDGWGYMGLYSTTPDENGKLPLVDTYAIPEALNPDYAIGFGDLSIHEQATDPTEPLTYTSWYSGGMRVFSFESGMLTPQGAFIDQEGNNFWGVEQFTGADGERYIAGSDRDYGLYIFRYTGPLAAARPGCTDSGSMVPFKGSGTVPLSCADANGNALTKSVVSGPSEGTVTNVDQAAGTATYTHTGGTLALDAFTFKANDGAADSADATARVQIVPGPGPRCFNPFTGTARAETIEGSDFGDRIRARGGNDDVNGRARGDCLNGGRGADKLRGGSGPDRLFGRAGRDRLVGGGQRDRLHGGSGNDTLRGGTANDRFFGGRGKDRIHAVDGWRERIRCGPGRDVVRADQKDRVSRSCETVLRIHKTR